MIVSPSHEGAKENVVVQEEASYVVAGVLLNKILIFTKCKKGEKIFNG